MKTNKQYIVVEYTEKYGWCLVCVCGANIELAKKALKEKQAMYPNKQFKINEIEEDQAWWLHDRLD